MSVAPLRILFLTADRFPPFRPDVEILFGKKFLERGHDIEWVMQAESGDGPHGQTSWRGCKVWIAPTNSGTGRLSRVHKHLLGLRNDCRVFSLLADGDYDFVQVKDKFLTAVLTLLAAKRYGYRFFYWLSFPYPEASLQRAESDAAKYRIFYLVRGLVFRFLLYGVICRFADHVFVQSEAMKRDLIGKGVPPSRLTAVPMGIDRASAAEEPDDAERKSIAPQSIVYLGSLGRDRQLEFLLDAFAEVSGALPEVRLYLVGDGDEPEDRGILEAHARSLGVADRVVFTGFLPRGQAMWYVEGAGVCASPIPPSPMYDVASPTKILEYMALSRPVVANDQPDQRAILDESGGGICTRFDVSEFAAAMIEILSDPARGDEMGRLGESYVAKHRSYDVLADRLETRYAALCGRAASSAAVVSGGVD